MSEIETHDLQPDPELLEISDSFETVEDMVARLAATDEAFDYSAHQDSDVPLVLDDDAASSEWYDYEEEETLDEGPQAPRQDPNAPQPAVDLAEPPPWLPKPEPAPVEEEAPGTELEVATGPASVLSKAKQLHGQLSTRNTPEPVAPPDSKLYVMVKEASFTGGASRRLVTDEKRDYTSTLNTVAASFKNLPPGCHGDIQVVAQNRPGFGAEGIQAISDNQNGVQQTGSFRTSANRFLIPLNTHLSDHIPVFQQKAAPVTQNIVDQTLTKDARAKIDNHTHATIDLRIGVWGPARHQEILDHILEDAIHAYNSTLNQGLFQSLSWKPVAERSITVGLLRKLRDETSLEVNNEVELPAILRVPDKSTAAEGVRMKRSAYVPLLPQGDYKVIDDPLNPPMGYIPYGIVSKGSTDEKIYGLQAARLDTHMLMLGSTGSGKTEELKWIAFGIAKSNYPLLIIDPHGEYAEQVAMALIMYCPERRKDIVYIDLSDENWPIAINPLDVSMEQQIQVAVSMIVSQIGGHLGIDAKVHTRAVPLLRFILTALIEFNLRIVKNPNAKVTLLDIVNFLTDSEFREQVTRFSKSQGVKLWFAKGQRYDSMKDKDRAEVSQVLITKFTQLGEDPLFRHIFSASQDRANFPRLAADRKIVIVNAAGGTVSPEYSGFICGFIPDQLHNNKHVFGRKTSPITGENVGGPGLRLIVDEAPSVLRTATTVNKISAEDRKADFGLIVASQYVNQFLPDVLEGLLNNTGTQTALHLKQRAAAPIAQSMGAKVQHIMQQEAWQLITTLKEQYEDDDGNTKMRTTPPFSLSTLAPLERYDPTWAAATAEEKQVRIDWAEQQFAEIRNRSHAMVCNPVELMAERTDVLTIVNPDESVTYRLRQTQLSIDEAMNDAAEREANANPIKAATMEAFQVAQREGIPGTFSSIFKDNIEEPLAEEKLIEVDDDSIRVINTNIEDVWPSI
jgi:hypothetical protein